MHRVKTIKFWQLIILAALLLSLLPIFGIAFYNHSSADDYSYGCMARYAWADTHNLAQVLKAVLEKVEKNYLEWQGSYAATALFALQPAVFGEQFYPLTTFLVMGLFLFALFYFFRKIVKKVFGGNLRIGDLIAGTAALLSIQLLPSPVEGFFWWNGSVYYVVFYSFMLIQAANLIAVSWEDKCSAAQMTGFLILAALISGGNYVSALLTVELTALVLLYAVCRKKKISGKLALVLAVSVACFLINCLAPGNLMRQAEFEAWSPIKAILYSYHEAYNYMVEWTSPLLLAGLVFLLPFLWCLPFEGILRYRFFALSLGIEFSLFASSFTPTLYAYGSVGEGRIQNIRYFFWVLLCMAAEFTVICFVKSMIRHCEERQGEFLALLKKIYAGYAAPFFATVVFCAAFFAGNSMLADDVGDFTSILAVKSLISGEAAEYDRETKERLSLLLSEESKVELKPYSSRPELLFLRDITEEPTDWENRVMAKFYRKEEVRLR